MIITGGAFDVMEIELQAGFVAECQEARGGGSECNGIADDDIFGGGADAAFGPGDGGQADGAVEVGHVEVDQRRAVIADSDDARG